MRTPSWSGFGRYLALRMADRGLETGSELARELGIDPSVINRWINGKTQPKVEHLRDLAPVLGVEPIELLIEAGYFPRRELMESARRVVEADERSAR